ncbi:hypothetical protein N0V90_002896 [Kalmusia sp. IMI 367209]|nr:hypothetical protein N0V90_002896 [Kalmusia sp. IMI 367209]
MLVVLAAVSILAGVTDAQFPTLPTDSIVVTSKVDPNVKISYKQTDLCETTPGVKSFSGFVNLPKSALYDMEFDFDIHTYFLYFEARNDPENAPLGIYLAGGPGESSTYSAMSGEEGPCYVNFDANSTTLNPWSLNNNVNMLYIDQPVGAGFSYTSLIKGTHDALEGTITPLSAYDGDVPTQNATFGQGTYTDPSPWSTTNTTISSAQALWHFAEHWLTQFPEYKSSNKNVGIWGNSAGGQWAPATGAQFDRKIKESSADSPLREWTVDNIGVTNGFIDFALAMPYYPEFAYNNTYGNFLDHDLYVKAKESNAMNGGCEDLVASCRAAGKQGDPLGRGKNNTVNKICQEATAACLPNLLILQEANNISSFDIAVKLVDNIPGGDPCPYYLPVHTFLNQEWTQKALGVPLNFTYISNTVMDAMTLRGNSEVGTGGSARADKSDIEYLLQSDIKVALVYGDRDARCPWTAAEGLVLQANCTAHDEFSAAGYEYIHTNETYNGGAVKQFGTFSFSRVFQSGHSVNTYQPETVARIFDRTFWSKDVATGKKDVGQGYGTKGPLSSWDMLKESLPETPGTCMVLGSFQHESVLGPLSQGNGTNGSNGSVSSGPHDFPQSNDGSSMQVGQRQLAAMLALLAVGFVVA